jgi:hypothetical protein
MTASTAADLTSEVADAHARETLAAAEHIAVAGPAVLGAAVLYSLYHLGYEMPADEMVFLFGLGVVYAIAFRLVSNILVLWPLLTPLGAFYNNFEAGDIDLPWASIAGFADVAVVMMVAVWFTARHRRRTIARRSETIYGALGAGGVATDDPAATNGVDAPSS